MRIETRVGLFVISAIIVFLYLSINIRAFRFDANQYYPYRAYFEDTGGVAAKAAIRIAGVEVGWVEAVRLLAEGRAELLLRIHKKNKLAKNAYAMIYQEGLIGTKSVEIDPGDPSTGLLIPGSTLSMPGKTPTNVGELLDQFRNIAGSIQDITNSLKSTFATRQAEQNLKLALNSVAQATERIADFSLIMKNTMARNEENINSMLSDLRDTSSSLKKGVPEVVDDIHLVSANFNKNADKVGNAFDQVEGAAKETGHVMKKINDSKGVVGKLINEDETYYDLKKSIRGIKEFVTKTQSVKLYVDTHSENMIRHTNSKGYFDIRLRPHSDYFYVIQLVGDEQGSITREVEHIERRDDKGSILRASEIDVPPERKIQFADQIRRVKRKENDILFGLQFGKKFNRLAFRLGIFESTFGLGIDYYVPLRTNKIHWITSIEAFDFRGTKRLNDSRPHVKWLNKAFFMKNLYTTFGIDDIYSKRQANPFFGGGIRFGDDDLKYFFSMFSKAGNTS